MKDYIENCRNYFESPAFYRRLLENSPDNELWFSQQPIGLNKLSSFNKTMFQKQEFQDIIPTIQEAHTTTTRCQAGVPEQEIMERTNHLLMDSVRKYKRPSTEMLIDISNLLEPQLENVKRATSQNRENHLSDPLPSPTTHFFKSVTFFFQNQNSSF